MNHPLQSDRSPAPQPGPQGPGGPAGPPPGSVRLLRMLVAPWLAQSLYALAEAGVAELLADGPRPSAELAAGTGLHADTLFRMLRSLASVGVFTESEPGVFGLTETGQFLRGDVPGTQKYSALLFGAETFRSWAEISHTARTGTPAFEYLHGVTFYDYLTDHPQAAETFNKVMGFAGVVPPAARALDLAGVERVVDVGGGNGTLLAALLAANPGVRGTLFDLKEAVDGSAGVLAAAGVADRCEVVAGSFFDGVPAGGDVYLLSRVLHNWSDEQAVAVLRGIREALGGSGRLVVFERLLPPGDQPSIGKLFDLVMMVVLGGRDRSAPEYRRLLDAAGFGEVEEHPGGGEVGVLVARPRG